MTTTNPFDLLGDIDNDDPSQLIIAAQQQQQQQQQKAAPLKKGAATAQASAPQPAQAKMPSKPLPPTQAVREAKNEVGSGRGGRGGGRGSGRGRSSGIYRDSSNNENSFNNGVPGGYGAVEDGDSGKPSERGRGSYGGPRGAFRGGRRGGFNNGEVREGDRQRRQFERHSGTGRGNEIKRDGAGRGNWGTTNDDIVQEPEELVNTNEKSLSPEKQLGEEDAAVLIKEGAVDEPEEKEPEDKEMTLDEYEKVLEEKRKALQALKTEERKVDLKDFESMQQLSSKKDNNDIFIKLGSEKDKRKEAADKEEKAKKSVSINEFLKPAEGTRFHGGRGRGRGDRGFRGGFAGGNMMNNMAAPSIEDRGQFPILGAN